MLHYVGNDYLTFVNKPAIEGFHRTQVMTQGTKSKKRRLCTELYDGDSILEHNLNLRSFYDEKDDQMNTVLRSNIRNTFDATVVVYAVPYNGRLYPPKIKGYRYRNAFSIDVSETMLEKYPALKGYAKILYGVVEVYASRFDAGHKDHMDKIFINILSKEDDAAGTGHNTSIVIYPHLTLVGGKETTEICHRVNQFDEWKITDPVPEKEIPWDFFGDPRTKKKKPARKNAGGKKPFRKPSNGDKRPQKAYGNGYHKKSEVIGRGETKPILAGYFPKDTKRDNQRSPYKKTGQRPGNKTKSPYDKSKFYNN